MKTLQSNDQYLETLSNNIQLLYEQNELLKLLNNNGIAPIVIGDSSAAVYYADPYKKIGRYRSVR